MRPDLWHYERRRDGSDLEQAVWDSDHSPGLAAHFHDEAQITIVQSGVRRFLTPLGPVAGGAGEAIILPAGLPHRPLRLDTVATLSINLYLPSSSCWPDAGVLPRVVPVPAAWGDGEPVDWLHLAEVPSMTRLPASEPSVLIDGVVRSHAPVAALAAHFRLSREGFIRRFSRSVGMTPQAYRIIRRANRARGLLGMGLSPAEAAAEAGFADQSHLGRVFRAAFGATPAAYRRSMLG